MDRACRIVLLRKLFAVTQRKRASRKDVPPSHPAHPVILSLLSFELLAGDVPPLRSSCSFAAGSFRTSCAER